jgi:alpha-tubulin suppressor-like RCC1 family protein
MEAHMRTPQRIVAALGLAGVAACGLFSPGDDDVETVLVSGVGDTLRGLNRTYQFEAFGLNRDGRAIPGLTFAWGSSDPSVASVDANGLVQTIATGGVTVSAETRGITGEAAVLVTDRVAMVAAGKGPVCALDSQGFAHCWGFWGGLPDLKLVPERIPGNLTFHSLSAGWDFHACGLTTGGEAYCWGTNISGELGDGTFGTPRPSPTKVAGDMRFKFLRTAAAHSCAIAFTGETYCWGLNQRGELGAPSSETCSFGPCSTVPIQVETDLRFGYLSLKAGESCGLDADGVLYCWGGTPTPVATDERFRTVSGAHFAMCGLGLDGVTYCWSAIDRLVSHSQTPAPLHGDPGFVLLGETAGGHYCGLDADSLAYCWGSNGTGQLGNGTFDNSSVPVPVSGGLRFIGISAGDQYTCAVTPDFDVYCWGFGPMGTGSMEGDGVPGCPFENHCWTTPVKTLFRP